MRNYLVAILVLFFIGIGCGELNDQHFQLPDRIITGVSRIYLHEPGIIHF